MARRMKRTFPKRWASDNIQVKSNIGKGLMRNGVINRAPNGESYDGILAYNTRAKGEVYGGADARDGQPHPTLYLERRYEQGKARPCEVQKILRVQQNSQRSQRFDEFLCLYLLKSPLLNIKMFFFRSEYFLVWENAKTDIRKESVIYTSKELLEADYNAEKVRWVKVTKLSEYVSGLAR